MKLNVEKLSIPIGWIVALLVVAYVGTWASCSVDDLSAKLADANARAASFEGRYDVAAAAYRELAFQVESDAELRKELEKKNATLAEEIARRGARILSLNETISTLRVALDDKVAPDTASTDEAGDIRFTLSALKTYDSGSFFRVSGPVHLTSLGDGEYLPRSALVLTGQLGVTTVLDRDGEDLVVSTFFDVPHVTVRDQTVINNVIDPLTAKPTGFWSNLKRELFDLTTWRHRAEGAAVIFLLTR